MKKYKVILIISPILIILLLIVSSVGYFTNIHQFFIDSKNSDGAGGYALVRDSNEFIVDGCGNGTMLDTVTGLCWLKNLNNFSAVSWDTAEADCANLDYAGHTNWRLPTRDELLTLIDNIGSSTTCPKLETFGFINCQNNYYWSGNEYPSDNSYAICVKFSSDNDNSYAKTTEYYVACVLDN